MARVDFLVDRETGAIFLNEINTIPGLHDDQHVPEAVGGQRPRLPAADRSADRARARAARARSRRCAPAPCIRRRRGRVPSASRPSRRRSGALDVVRAAAPRAALAPAPAASPSRVARLQARVRALGGSAHADPCVRRLLNARFAGAERARAPARTRRAPACAVLDAARIWWRIQLDPVQPDARRRLLPTGGRGHRARPRRGHAASRDRAEAWFYVGGALRRACAVARAARRAPGGRARRQAHQGSPRPGAAPRPHARGRELRHRPLPVLRGRRAHRAQVPARGCCCCRAETRQRGSRGCSARAIAGSSCAARPTTSCTSSTSGTSRTSTRPWRCSRGSRDGFPEQPALPAARRRHPGRLLPRPDRERARATRASSRWPRATPRERGGARRSAGAARPRQAARHAGRERRALEEARARSSARPPRPRSAAAEAWLSAGRVAAPARRLARPRGVRAEPAAGARRRPAEGAPTVCGRRSRPRDPKAAGLRARRWRGGAPTSAGTRGRWRKTLRASRAASRRHGDALPLRTRARGRGQRRRPRVQRADLVASARRATPPSYGSACVELAALVEARGSASARSCSTSARPRTFGAPARARAAARGARPNAETRPCAARSRRRTATRSARVAWRSARSQSTADSRSTALNSA